MSWTPALGAEGYEVQWSKTQYPFNPITASTGALGIMTSATSVVLPVTPGTWWYRVRGFDWSLPTGAQQMSWSDPAKLVVAAPKFKLVSGSTTSAPTKVAAKRTAASGLHTMSGTGFTMGIPTGWTHRTVKDSVVSFFYVDNATRTNVVEVSASGRGTRTMTQWEADLKAEAASAHLAPAAALVTLAAGRAVRLTVSRVVGGKSIVQVEYIVDGGTTAYGFTFTTTAARYAADAPTFAKMIDSLKLTA